jgi:hypothetical protein
VLVSWNITENEILFNKEKIGGPSPRVGSLSGAMVHGGQRAWAQPGLTGELAWHHHTTPKLTTRAAIARGGRPRTSPMEQRAKGRLDAAERQRDKVAADRD